MSLVLCVAAAALWVRGLWINDIVGPNPKIFKLAEGFQFTEGPVWVLEGEYLLFGQDHDRNLKEVSRHSPKDADAYDRLWYPEILIALANVVEGRPMMEGFEFAGAAFQKAIAKAA